MKFDDKRSCGMSAAAVQENSRKWWTSIPMTYDDWGKGASTERFTAPWYDEIDSKFLHAARLFSTTANPFEALMGADQLRGKRVLEIGCGMGFHAEMLARAGAELTAIDLSPTSVESTTKRFALKKLSADIREMDAESLKFPDESFDMVWSWGVILASARTGRIVREIHRVLKPGGETRIMVYNLEGTPAYSVMLTRYMLGYWFGKSLDELLWRSTDGFTARFYTRDTFTDLLATFFDDIEISSFGEEGNVVPLPRPLRRPLLKMIPMSRQRRLAPRRASYLFGVAKKGA